MGQRTGLEADGDLVGAGLDPPSLPGTRGKECHLGTRGSLKTGEAFKSYYESGSKAIGAGIWKLDLRKKVRVGDDRTCYFIVS